MHPHDVQTRADRARRAGGARPAVWRAGRPARRAAERPVAAGGRVQATGSAA